MCENKTDHDSARLFGGIFTSRGSEKISVAMADEDWGVDELIVEDSWKRKIGGD